LSTEVEHNNIDKEKERDRIDWRRSKVQELSSQGHSQREIAQMLQVSNGTVNKDLFILKRYIIPAKLNRTISEVNFVLRKQKILVADYGL
jgi:Trp operon repressor